MGKIWVDVLFGSKDNHRIESLEFEVVDLECPYHALLGGPALAKFMASTRGVPENEDAGSEWDHHRGGRLQEVHAVCNCRVKPSRVDGDSS